MSGSVGRRPKALSDLRSESAAAEKAQRVLTTRFDAGTNFDAVPPDTEFGSVSGHHPTMLFGHRRGGM